MPVSKRVRRAAREGGNVGNAPTEYEGPYSPMSETDRSDVERPTPKGIVILTVISAKIKKGSRGPYRSLTGKAADGKFYWAPIEATYSLKKGQVVTLKGELKGIFGGEDGKPEYHKILGSNWYADLVSVEETPEPAEPADKKPLKFEGKDAEGLLKSLKSLVREHGISTILKALAKIIT